MKRECVEQHQYHQQQLNHSHHHHHLPFSPPFQLSRNSEDDDTPSTAAAVSTPRPTTTTPPSSASSQKFKHRHNEPNSGSATDGATIEMVRRPRGRPSGSKNKPKPPVIITREPEPAMSPYILEVSGGSNVVEAISRFCRRKNIGICILTGSGTVANVTLRQPSMTTTTTPGTNITFHGRFDILSIAATFLPQAAEAACPVPNTFTISLAGPQGQIVGGIVAGALVAAGTVYVLAATFNSPSYHRLPIDEEGRTSGSAGTGEGQSPAGSGAAVGGESGQHAPSGVGESCGMAMYSCHLPSDVIWAPTARPPPF